MDVAGTICLTSVLLAVANPMIPYKMRMPAFSTLHKRHKVVHVDMHETKGKFRVNGSTECICFCNNSTPLHQNNQRFYRTA